MKQEMKATPHMGAGLYEYAFIPVPQSQRKSGISIFFVLAGYSSTLSCMVLGARISASMPFWQAIGALLLGDLVLIAIGTGMGVLSALTGWSTAFLAQRILGRSASAVFAVLLLCCTMLWVGVNGSLFSTMIIAVFPGWRLPVSVTALFIIVIWAMSASGGWKSMDIASKIVVPGCIGILLYTIIRLFIQMDGVNFLAAEPTSAPMTFTAALAAVIGNFIFGIISTPDTCRFARSSKSVLLICPCAYGLGMFVFHVCGVVVAKAGGFSDFNRSAAVAGILLPMLFCAVFSLVTTQNMNIYISSLALQSLFQGTRLEGYVSHKTVVCLIAGAAVALSVSGISDYLVPMVTYLSIVMVPLPGMLFGEALFFRNKKQKVGKHWDAVAIWIVGSCASYLFLYLNLPIASILGMLFSGICYVIVNIQSRKSVQ